MSRFSVPVTTKAPEETCKALDAAGVPKVGPTFSRYTASNDGWRIGPRVTPVIEAENAEAAEARIRDIVGGECEIGPVRPFGADD